MNTALIQSEQLSLPKAKVKNSTFWNIVKSVVCQSSIALHINFNSEGGFQIIKICRNCKFQGCMTRVINKIIFTKFCTKYSRQILESTWKCSRCGTSWRWFFAFSSAAVKIFILWGQLVIFIHSLFILGYKHKI